MMRKEFKEKLFDVLKMILIICRMIENDSSE